MHSLAISEFVYHFTSEEGRDGILRDRRIKMSTNTTRDAYYGKGVYLTDVPPGGDDNELLRKLYGRAYQSKMKNIAVCFRFRARDLKPLVEAVEEKRKVYVTPAEIDIDRVTTDMMSRPPGSNKWSDDWQRV